MVYPRWPIRDNFFHAGNSVALTQINGLAGLVMEESAVFVYKKQVSEFFNTDFLPFEIFAVYFALRWRGLTHCG